MGGMTWGTELDPRLNQPEMYCCECGEPCGMGSHDVKDEWWCADCWNKREDGPQDDRWLEAENWVPDPRIAMNEARKLK